MGELKKQKAITLVSLVITIVILLILAGISISALTNQGLFGKAKEAKQKSENAQREENDILADYYDKMEAATGKAKTYKVGDSVSVDGEKFYVIKDSGAYESKVTLLAEKNLDTNTMKQSDSANKNAFSSTNYWSSISGIKYPYDLNNIATSVATDAIAIARTYGASKGGTGRLMTLDEVLKLGANKDTQTAENCPDWIKTSDYWLSSASTAMYLYALYGQTNTYHANMLYGGCYFGTSDLGVRPVIEISKSKIS